MRSFTFSFDRAPSSGGWWQLVIVAAVFVLTVAAIETTLVARGGSRSANLSEDRWARNLQSAIQSADPYSTVLLGASQMRAGFSSDAFSARYPNTPLFYLATAGESPFATLLFIAHETEFSGNLIVSIQEEFLETSRLEEQRYLLDFFEREWKIDTQIDFFIEDRYGLLTFRQPRFALQNVLDSLIRGNGLPTARDWRHNRRNGESDYHFDRAEPARLVDRRGWHYRMHQSADIDEWIENFRRMDAAIAAIHDRGGHVALVKYPLAASWFTRNRLRFPKEQFWDRAMPTGTGVAVDAMAIAVLGGFPQPDGNHLDAGDKGEFTDLLLDVLEARGMRFAASKKVAMTYHFSQDLRW